MDTTAYANSEMNKKNSNLKNDHSGETSGSAHYRIIIKGQLEESWTAWFQGMKIEKEGPNTVLTGTLPDQSALHGLLIRVRDLNIPLLLVEQTGWEESVPKKEDIPREKEDRQ